MKHNNLTTQHEAVQKNEKAFLSEDLEGCFLTAKLESNPGCFLRLPNLHINFYHNKEQSYIRALCLDFGFFATAYNVSAKNKDEKIREAGEKIRKMAQTHLQNIIHHKDFDHLFLNRIKNQGHWEFFAEKDNQEHIKELEDSYKDLENNPEKYELIKKMHKLLDSLLRNPSIFEEYESIQLSELIHRIGDVIHKKLDTTNLMQELLNVTIKYQFPNMNQEPK